MAAPLSRWLPALGALALLAACAPAPAAAPLPPPLLLQVTETPRPTLPLPDETPEATRTPLPATLEELARAEYGPRLVDWVRIDALGVFAPVTPVGWLADPSPEDPLAVEWESPGAKVGWALGSALPGDEAGNILLYGHNNIHSRVFRDLADLRSGDVLQLTTAERQWEYEVAEVNILPVLEGAEDRAAYAQYLSPGLTPRLTLISCWPPDNNTHRVIVVAHPRSYPREEPLTGPP